MPTNAMPINTMPECDPHRHQGSQIESKHIDLPPNELISKLIGGSSFFEEWGDHIDICGLCSALVRQAIMRDAGDCDRAASISCNAIFLLQDWEKAEHCDCGGKYVRSLVQRTARADHLQALRSLTEQLPDHLDLFIGLVDSTENSWFPDLGWVRGRISIVKRYWQERLPDEQDWGDLLRELCCRISSFKPGDSSEDKTIVGRVGGWGLDRIDLSELKERGILTYDRKGVQLINAALQDFLLARWCLSELDDQNIIDRWGKIQDSRSRNDGIISGAGRLISIKNRQFRLRCLRAMIEMFLESERQLEIVRGSFLGLVTEYFRLSPLVAQLDLINTLGWFLPSDLLDPGRFSGSDSNLSFPPWLTRDLLQSLMFFENTSWQVASMINWPIYCREVERKLLDKIIVDYGLWLNSRSFPPV